LCSSHKFGIIRIQEHTGTKKRSELKKGSVETNIRDRSKDQKSKTKERSIMSTLAQPISLDELSLDSRDGIAELKLMSRKSDARISLASMTDRFESVDDTLFDMNKFKEECWVYIKEAVEAGGISELATRVQEDETEESGGDDGGHILVAVRTRPINERELRLQSRGCVEHLHDRKNIIVRKFNSWGDNDPYDMSFAFDQAFNESSTQAQVFKFMGWKALRNVFSGYNVSIFAYGQTG
jgi:hypothetical protein